MTPETQRIAIAEACGWRLRRDNPKYDWYWTNPEGFEVCWSGALKPVSILSCLPDYPNDLNAMHEAEGVLTDEQWRIYCPHLHDAAYHIRYAVHATAAQRAEAFLRTLGLWKEAEPTTPPPRSTVQH